MGSIYLPPIARKKKVDGYPRHDTSRVLMADLQGRSAQGQTSYEAHYVGHTLELSPLQSLSAGRKNKPHPNNLTFLRQNPRFICEPVCHVKTSCDSQHGASSHSWWPTEIPEKISKVPAQYSLDSTTRSDYCPPATVHGKSSRSHTNPNMEALAAGILLQTGKTDPKLTTVREKISYEHQFNSRLDPSQPIRGRRHGSFIWDVVSQKGNRNIDFGKSLENKSEGNSNCDNHQTVGAAVHKSQPEEHAC